ncbi:Mss4-like protein [Geopyxis carbonaria]|nr:Mss4-like protein [Geopyxis carbonaria]
MDVLGKCHCGELEWMTHFPERELPANFLCHCESCRMFGAGGYSVNTIVPKNHVKVTKGKPKEYTYSGGSGNSVHCYYCPNCTVHAFHHEEVLGERYTMHPLLIEGNEHGERNPKIGMEVFYAEKAKFQPQIAKTVYNQTDSDWAENY